MLTLLVLLASICGCWAATFSCSISGKAQLHVGKVEGIAAWAEFYEELATTGWNKLTINTPPAGTYADEDVMFCVGYVEGAITRNQIYQWYQTTAINYYQNKTVNPQLQEFMIQQWEWVNFMISHSGKDPYWNHVRLVARQLEGLLDGYNDYSPPEERV